MLAYRYLFEQMVRRELRAKYKGSALGVLWYIVNPLVLMVVYATMFSTLLGAVDIDDYPLFLLIGLIVWTFFSQSLLSSSTALVEQASLVSKVRFPRETVPAAVVSVQLVPFAVLLAVIIPLSIIIRDSASAALLLLPLVIVCLYAFTLGLSMVASVLHAYYRDVQPVLAAVLLPWFFVTPIFFEIDALPGLANHPNLEGLLRWGNPIAPFIEAIRAILYSGDAPQLNTCLYVLGVTAITAVGGRAVFKRMEGELAVVL
jgi:lipopolysaccharide transport system permease protein